MLDGGYEDPSFTIKVAFAAQLVLKGNINCDLNKTKSLFLASSMQKFSSGKQPSPDRNLREVIPHLWPILYTLDTATHNVVIKKALFMIPGERCRNKTRGLKKAPAAYSPPLRAGGKHHDLSCLVQILMLMVQRRWSPGQPGRPRAVST